MYTSFFAILALVLSSMPFTLAFEFIDIDFTVSAGTDTTIHIINDLPLGYNSFDATFDSY